MTYDARRPTSDRVQRERRKRADEALARYDEIKAEVIATARGRLVAQRLHLPDLDLDAFYNAAWHAMHCAILAGENVVNEIAWLVVALERRAIDELRSATARGRVVKLSDEARVDLGTVEPDFAQQLDDRARVRRVRTALRSRLSGRERHAAALVLFWGCTRAEVAEILGVQPRRADRIIEAVHRKTEGLLRAIENGPACEEQRSLITAFALGILDPEGERHAIALQHVLECPHCAAFVRSHRAACALIPAPMFATAAATSGGLLGMLAGFFKGSGAGAVGGSSAGVSGATGILAFGGAGKVALCVTAAACVGGLGVGVATELQHGSPPPAAAAVAPAVGATAPRSLAPPPLATPSTSQPDAQTVRRRPVEKHARPAPATTTASPSSGDEFGIEAPAATPSMSSPVSPEPSGGPSAATQQASTEPSDEFGIER